MQSNRDLSRAVALFVIQCVFVLLFPASGFTQTIEGHCASDVQQVAESKDPLGYRLRESRCEGRYGYETTANNTVRVAGFVETFAGYPSAQKELFLEWSLPQDAAVLLQAVALKPRTYYRMDAHRSEGDRTYTWPLDVLAALALDRQQVGVSARFSFALGKVDREVYAPLRISSAPNAARASEVTFLLLPGRELTEVYLSVIRMGDHGDEAEILVDEQPLALGYYPADRPFRVPIRKPETPGIYAVEISVETTGADDGLKLWFYNDGL